MFREVIEELAKRDNSNDGDYEKDNILYCGKCHTPKQAFVTWFDGTKKKVPVVCSCEKEKERKQREEQRVNEIRRTIDFLRMEGLTEAKYASRTFEKDDGGRTKQERDISNLCRRYVDKWDDVYRNGIGLLMYGNVGTGKSFYACCIANALVEKGVPVLVTSFPKILSKIQSSFDDGANKMLNKLQKFDLVVIDDFGTERFTSFAMEQLFQVVESRLLCGKPMVVTTNLTPSDIKNPENTAYERIYDRFKEMLHPVAFQGESRRDLIAKKNRQIFKEVLGDDVI